MNKKKLKQAKLKNGRIFLEGMLLQNPEILAVKTLSTVFGNIMNGIEQHQSRLYENILDKAPEGADTYIIGNSLYQISEIGFGGYDSVLYLNSRMGGDKI